MKNKLLHFLLLAAIVVWGALAVKIVPAALCAFMGVLGILLIRQRRRIRHHRKPTPHRQASRRDTTPTGLPRVKCVPELIGLPEVEAFFLNLYRRQLGATPEASGLITSSQDKNNRAGHIYNLSVKHKGQWASRHMTIRPIGEITHSKSQCFYVIFDTHMVVKIPPVPIKDFTDFIHRIERENTLVDALAPLVCITPNISVILSRIQKLAGVGAIPARGSEEKYIRFLKAAPEYHTCCKIGDAFAFFMDLSRHFFLSYVLAELHDVEGEIQKTLASDAAVMLHGLDFETKYGLQNVQTCLDLQGMYSRFESELTTCLIQPNEQLNLSDKQKREWFFTHLSGGTISRPTSSALSDAFMVEIYRLLQAVISPSEATVTAYQKIVRDHAEDLVFNQHRPQFGEMITNLLGLLDFLGKKRVCLRDLKPDNLLVAGKTGNYPLFLLSADDYSIGLIDLETAVQLGQSDNEPPAQPYLGGTPAYATPSHFATNSLLHLAHDNLPWILHLQDWYAVVGIIFEIVIGHRLFLKTGSQIPSVIQAFQQAHIERRDLREVYLTINGAFWKSAKAEFTQKTKENASRLDKIMVRVPTTLKNHILTYLSTKPEKIRFSLLSDKSDGSGVTLSAKNLMEGMFGIVADTMDVKDLSTRNTYKNADDLFWEYQRSEYETCSIGYTLTGEIQKS